MPTSFESRNPHPEEPPRGVSKDEDIRLRMRALLVLTTLVSSTLIGTNAFAHRAAQSCYENYDDAFLKKVEVLPSDQSWKQRNASIEHWVKFAEREKLTEIWGEPQLYKEQLEWSVPLEAGLIVSDIGEESGEYCFYSYYAPYRILVIENVDENDISKRILRKVVR